MVVSCEQVWQEVSNYLDGEVDPTLRVAIEEHVHGCSDCAAVVEGTRNVIQLYGDERMLEVPLGYSHRLQQRLQHQSLSENLAPSRRSFLGWMAAAAAACLIAGTIEVARFSAFRDLRARSQMAQHGGGVPPDMMVLASENEKLFHIKGCIFIREQDKVRAMTAAKAEGEGYAPCPHCMKKYLVAT